LDILGREVERARREGTRLSIALADVDYFKQVNDAYGHMAGDHVLAAVAGTMRDMMRPYDEAGRYGGEEFLITLPGCGESEAGRVTERLRERLAATPIRLHERLLAVTVSVGVASLDAGVITDVSALIRAADKVLSEAKKNDRNRVMPASAAGASEAARAQVAVGER
jgi:diguanylate cyclase (GGDEF)-like protein